MKPLVAYKVTRGSKDSTLVNGNIVWKSEDNTLIVAGKNGGCLAKGEWEDLDFEIEECLAYKVIKDKYHEKLVKVHAQH